MQTTTPTIGCVHDASIPGLTIAGCVLTLLSNATILPSREDFVSAALEQRHCQARLAAWLERGTL